VVRRACLVALVTAGCGGGSGGGGKIEHRRFAAADGARAVAIGDVDGDGRNEIVVADATQLRVLRADGTMIASSGVPGGIQILRIADLDGDGTGEILAGWGRSREQPDAPARVDRYRVDSGALVDETITQPQSERAEIAAIVPAPPGLVIAWFASKYLVTSANATPAVGGWKVSPIATIRMATSYARGDIDGDGTPELVVGRLYGDDIDTPGDAFVLGATGVRTPIPTTRGVHALAVAPDGAIWMGDGWDADYGHKARGRLDVVKRGVATLVEDVAADYTIDAIAIADVDGDGAPEVIAKGNADVRVYWKRGDAWAGMPVAGAVDAMAVGDVDGAPGAEVVVVGAQSEVIGLRGLQGP
jgi:hypothetical protein